MTSTIDFNTETPTESDVVEDLDADAVGDTDSEETDDLFDEYSGVDEMGPAQPPMPPPPPPPAPPVQPNPAPAPQPAARPRTWSFGAVFAVVAGVLMLVPGFGVLTSGIGMAVGSAIVTDDDGYFRFTPDRVMSDGVAVIGSDLFDDMDVDTGGEVFDFIDLSLRVRADGATISDEVFVGVARTADVEFYLEGAGYSDVAEFIDRRPVYLTTEGDGDVAPPTEQNFWAVSAVGSGEQELTWDARPGNWAVVVMNADGTPGVVADVELGARTGVVTPIAVGLIIGGTVMLLISLVLIVGGARRGRRRAASAS